MKGKVECQTDELFGDNIADMIVTYSKGVKADLISIMTEQASGINLILGNTAHQVINKSDMPVLSMTPREIRVSGGTFSTFGG
jgi:nucleotide-binding universal stress UspA family protein